MQFKDGQTIGIDLGTTFSAVAQVNEEGDPLPVVNEEEELETPSLVLLVEGGHVVVGPNKMRAAMEDPENIVDRVKRHMGDREFKRTFDGREITSEFLSALILKKLRQDASKQLGTEVANAVITVPYYFNDSRRKATEDAGRIAGLNVIDIINEPTAATLTYAWKRGELGSGGEGAEPRQALVYDLGGGTFDVTVVRYTPTHFQVLATDGDVELGGVDWNDRLAEYVASEFQQRHDVDIRESAATMQMLRHDCDHAKIMLTDSDQTEIMCRHGDKRMTVPITRDHFEELTADLLQRTLDTTDLVIETAKISASDLDAVVLVGGSTLMPAVPRALEQITGIKPYDGLSPHTAVAQGAAIHAAILETKHRGEASGLAERVRKMLANVQQDEVNSHALGVAIRSKKSGGLINHVMIPKNSPLPAEKRQEFVTHKEGQNRVSVKVIEGDAPDPMACSFVGKCRIEGLPADLPKGSPIEVTYAFDASGRVNVSAKELNGGKEAEIVVERRGGLNEQQVDAYTQLAEKYQVD